MAGSNHFHMSTVQVKFMENQSFTWTVRPPYLLPRIGGLA
jgi:hypothetical protein